MVAKSSTRVIAGICFRQMEYGGWFSVRRILTKKGHVLMSLHEDDSRYNAWLWQRGVLCASAPPFPETEEEAIQRVLDWANEVPGAIEWVVTPEREKNYD